MQLSHTRRLVYTAVFVALGVLIPFAFHTVLAGPIFLPMHIPVLLAGILLGPLSGVVVGFLSPLISSATGMPTFFMLPIMMAQLATTGFVSGFLSKRLRLSVFISLPTAMLVGRLVFVAMFYFVTNAFGFTVPSISPLLNANTVWAFLFVIGWPGIAIQLLMIPLVVKSVEMGNFSLMQSKNTKLINTASSMIHQKSATFVLIKDRKIQLSKMEIGVKSALKLYKSDPSLLSNAIIVDKVVGKAAAMIFILGKIKFIHAHVLSHDAKEFLIEHNIPFSFEKVVSNIKNRTHDDICPLEKAVLNEDCPEKGLLKIETKIEELMRTKS
ncbi:MAG: DUF1893 domain-containing protein [Firmicutes bacterium]|nr:DUF1893 domain-containing protein [Bacillota bacterium]